MKMNKSLFILLTVVVLIVVGIAVAVVLKGPIGQKNSEETGITPPVATGNLGDISDALDKEVQDEMDVVYDEDDTNLIISDASQIDEFGQAADDTGL